MVIIIYLQINLRKTLKKNTIVNFSVYIMKQQSVHLFVQKKETFSKVYFKRSVEF